MSKEKVRQTFHQALALAPELGPEPAIQATALQLGLSPEVVLEVIQEEDCHE